MLTNYQKPLSKEDTPYPNVSLNNSLDEIDHFNESIGIPNNDPSNLLSIIIQGNVYAVQLTTEKNNNKIEEGIHNNDKNKGPPRLNSSNKHHQSQPKCATITRYIPSLDGTFCYIP